MIGSESDWQDGGLWTLIILDFHTGGFCDLRIYLLALGFAGLPQVESIIRGFATTTRQRAPVTLLSSLPWASLLLSCDVAPSAVMRDLLNSALSGWSGRRDSNPRPSAPKADALPGYATPRFSDCIAIGTSGVPTEPLQEPQNQEDWGEKNDGQRRTYYEQKDPVSPRLPPRLLQMANDQRIVATICLPRDVKSIAQEGNRSQ